MHNAVVLILDWLPEGRLDRLVRDFPGCEFVDGRQAEARDRHLERAVVTYGLPPLELLPKAPALRWVQLISAGVPPDLCPAATRAGLTVTNLAGLYGPSIAEHALAMLLTLTRNLQTALCNQKEVRWDRGVARGMADVNAKTLALLGVGNIGQNVARLARSCGMRVTGFRRTPRPAPFVDHVFGPGELSPMLGEADYVVVTAPLTAQTRGMLGPAEFRSMKRGVIYINVSRGGVAQEQALVEALQSGHVAAAGLDVFAAEPLPPDHTFWGMPQVLVSPHFSGEVVNASPLPSERFARNLRSWLAGKELEGLVRMDHGY